MKTSIILTAHIQSSMQAHMTMACIANITRYTPRDEYELILMSADEKYPVRDDYKVLQIDRYERGNWGYTKSMNEGAKLAKGEILVFLQNDVFVWEGWLTGMKLYIENGHAEAVFPDQCPRSREFVESSYIMTPLAAMRYGSRDAGCLMITKEAFQKTGGWNEELSLLAEKDFYHRMAQAGVGITDTCKVMITHIMAATNLSKDQEKYNAEMKHDADLLNK